MIFLMVKKKSKTRKSQHSEYNLYIGDVKVSPEGRCLDLLQ